MDASYVGHLADDSVSGIVLEKVAEYFYYNYKNRDAEDVPDMDIPPELCLELLMAADFLDSMFLPEHFFQTKLTMHSLIADHDTTRYIHM